MNECFIKEKPCECADDDGSCLACHPCQCPYQTKEEQDKIIDWQKRVIEIAGKGEKE